MGEKITLDPRHGTLALYTKPSTLYPRQKDRLACVQMSPISVAAWSPQTEYDPWGLISRDAKYERTNVTQNHNLGFVSQVLPLFI